MRPGAPDTSTEQGALIQWLFANSRELMFVVASDGRFKLVSPAWTTATGWSPDELVGEPVIEFIHPDDRAEFVHLVKRLAATGVGENAARVRMKNGSWRWYEGRSQLSADGQFLGVLRDVHDERSRAAELEDARRTRLLLSESAGIAAWGFEPERDEVEWSDEFLNITGYAPGEIRTSANFEGIIHPDDRERAQRALIAGVAKGRGASFETRIRTKAGRWMTWRVTFHTEARPGDLHALKGICQNITELARARDAALRSEQQIGQLVENAPFAVAMFDRQMRYMVVSSRWRAIFSLGHRDYIGRTLKEVWPTIPRRFTAAQSRALAGEVVASPEDRFTDGQGGKHWVRWEARPWRDANGRIAGVICYVDDISALANARQEAQTNARRLKMALNVADAGVYEIDHAGRSFWMSPEFKKLIGDARAGYEAALKLEFPRFHPDDVERVRESFRSISAGGRQGGDAFEARVLTDRGQERWIRVFHHLQKDRRGRWLKGVGLVQDFDARKRQELALVEAQQAAESAADAKAAFLANMSHEIRTPMNGVMGVLHLLKSEQLTEDGRRMLEEALSCGQMLSELLNDVIDFSKIEAGHMELSLEATSPAALADGVVRLLRPMADAKGLKLVLEPMDDLGWVRADPVRLRQALFNLVGNAVKFTLQGQVVLRARMTATDMLRFEVEDTGVGIPAAVQPRIFHRFDQGDASTTRRFGGSGLGLAITQRLAEMMGGQVGFTSVEGQGSTFWLDVSAPPAESAIAAEADTGDDVLDGLRILVVEDNATNRMIATKLLENLGAVVETAADGLLGVAAATRGGFDLILMDVQMPGIDGLEACRRIRELPAPVCYTPIVALTANVLSHQRRAYLDAGMDGVVGKPISPASLLTEIARLSEPARQSGEGQGAAA